MYGVKKKRAELVYKAPRDYVRAAKLNADAKVLANPKVAFVNSVWNAIAFGSVAEYYLYKASDELRKLGIADQKRESMVSFFNHFKEKLYETNTGGEELTLDYMMEITKKIRKSLDAFVNAAEKNIREMNFGNPYALASLACAMKFMEETEDVYNLVVKPLKKFGATIPDTMGTAFIYLDLSYYKAAELLNILDPNRKCITCSHENTEKTFHNIIVKLLSPGIVSSAAKKAIESNGTNG